MISPDTKRIATVIMARRAPEGGERISGPAPMKVENTRSETGEIDGRQVASEDILAALHEKSPRKMMEALANFIDLHATSAVDKE